MKYELSPSILASDFSCLGDQIKEVEKAGVNWLHIDVMDGTFVPSISFGMPVITSIRKRTDLFFDVHLMVNDPERYVDDFKKAGADLLCVHAEACPHLDRTLNRIHEAGMKAGVALNPATPLCMIEEVLGLVDMVLIMSVNPGFGGQKYIPYAGDKVRRLRKMLKDRNLSTDIEVDGGVSTKTIDEVLEAGANILVAGSAVFKGDIVENAGALIKKIEDFKNR